MQAEVGQSFPNIDPVMTFRTINWELPEELQREVHEGLNVVESWNNTNGFIFSRTLSPLLMHHINPYGRLELDLETRLLIEEIVSYDN